jgi:hypothetical protein
LPNKNPPVLWERYHQKRQPAQNQFADLNVQNSAAQFSSLLDVQHVNV